MPVANLRFGLRTPELMPPGWPEHPTKRPASLYEYQTAAGRQAAVEATAATRARLLGEKDTASEAAVSASGRLLL